MAVSTACGFRSSGLIVTRCSTGVDSTPFSSTTMSWKRWSPVDPGDHLFQLIVVDENGVESTPVEQRVTISPDDRKPQAVLTAMPAEVAFGEPFTLDGTESAPVPGHQITSYKWIMMT